jgi:hypothetical protein
MNHLGKLGEDEEGAPHLSNPFSLNKRWGRHPSEARSSSELKACQENLPHSKRPAESIQLVWAFGRQLCRKVDYGRFL